MTIMPERALLERYGICEAALAPTSKGSAWFVKQDDMEVQRHCEGNGDLLLLLTGKLRRVAPEVFSEFHAIKG